MIGVLVKEAAGVLERRFLLNAFLPTLVWLGSITAAVLWEMSGPQGMAATWRHFNGIQQVVVAVIAVAIGALLAGVLSAQVTNLVRWFEGYWYSPLGRCAARWGTSWHRRRLAALASRAAKYPDAYQRIYSGYPMPGQEVQVMPTRIGNVIRGAELHARDRYGLDSVLVWSRILPVLPDRVTQTLGAGRADLELMVTISALGGSGGAVIAIIVLVAHGPWTTFLASVAVGTTIAWAAYRSAIATAMTYAEQVKAAFDVFRVDLLRQLGITISPSSDMAVERAIWQRLGLLWYRAVPDGAELQVVLPSPKSYRFAVLPLSGLALLVVVIISAGGAAYLA